MTIEMHALQHWMSFHLQCYADFSLLTLVSIHNFHLQTKSIQMQTLACIVMACNPYCTYTHTHTTHISFVFTAFSRKSRTVWSQQADTKMIKIDMNYRPLKTTNYSNARAQYKLMHARKIDGNREFLLQ